MSDKTTLKKRIGTFLKDTVTLDVITLTGSIELDASVTTVPAPAANQQDEASLNWDELFAKVTQGMQPNADNKLEVLAYTHGEWDCDSVNYIKSSPSDMELKIIESHHKAVESAHKSRYAALEFIGKALGSI
ncbi:hypothetical protein VDG1235_4920 [Verrucomicrobiia bacterium DG1235]|nr:hypothetical protein VDG1235_4920 [Verrucomicrobiae bacterium DG1235]